MFTRLFSEAVAEGRKLREKNMAAQKVEAVKAEVASGETTRVITA